MRAARRHEERARRAARGEEAVELLVRARELAQRRQRAVHVVEGQQAHGLVVDVRALLPAHGAGARVDADQIAHQKGRAIAPQAGEIEITATDADEEGVAHLFALLGAESIGMRLTEHCAMTPAASVSGFYLAHPQARYFNVGRIGEDQVHDLAQRQGVEVKDLQRLLAPNL